MARDCIGTIKDNFGKALVSIIWAVNLLPCLITAHIDIETPGPSDQECAIDSASDLPLRLSNLQQLSFQGSITVFLEQSIFLQLMTIIRAQFYWRNFHHQSSCSIKRSEPVYSTRFNSPAVLCSAMRSPKWQNHRKFAIFNRATKAWVSERWFRVSERILP